MRRNTCNAGPGEGFQVQSGEVDGFSTAKTEGAAFRELIKKAGKPVLGELARFRLVRLRPKGSYGALTPWLYQDNESLKNTK